jgi:UDP:flavonoid glycosyltransferase YjiC (YdhE family)
MRVLFAAMAGEGDFFPLVPLAWAFRAAGHEVVIATAEITETVAKAGLPVVDVAPGYSGDALLNEMFTANPDLGTTWANEPTPTDGTGSSDSTGSTDGSDDEAWAMMLAEINRPLVAGTLNLVDQWKPDLVVFEQAATFGLMAAAYGAVPAVQRNISDFRTNDAHNGAIAHLPDLCEQYGISELPEPILVLEYGAPSMLPGEAEGIFLREAPYAGGSILGDALPQPATGKPRVAVTMGTAQYRGFDPIRPIIAAAAEIDAEFVLALGEADPAPLGPLPPNVRTTGWIALDALLPTCAAVIHHGGAGTTMLAIEAGTPQLVVLGPTDQGETAAETVRKRGMGMVTTEDEVDADLIRRLLNDKSLRTATQELQAELASLPTTAETVTKIVALMR